MTSPHELIVIGGGISGLGLASLAAESGLSTLLLEKSPRLGGAIQTERLGDDYWFEMGAHTVYNSYGLLIDRLSPRLGPERLLARNRLPFLATTGESASSIAAHFNLWELLTRLPRVRSAMKRKNRSVRDYFTDLVGPDNYKRILSGALSGVALQPIDDYPAAMLFKKRPRHKRVPRSFTLPNGLSTLVELLQETPGLETRTGVSMERIERTETGYRLHLSEGESLETRRLGIATPPDAAAALLREVAPRAAEQLARIPVHRFRTFGATIASPAVELPPVAGLIPTDQRYYSIVSRDVLSDGGKRAFTIHVPPAVEYDDAKARLATLIQADASRFEYEATCERTLPSPRFAIHGAVLAFLESALDETLFVTGNYFEGLAIEDCLARSRREFERLTQARASRALASPAVG